MAPRPETVESRILLSGDTTLLTFDIGSLLVDQKMDDDGTAGDFYVLIDLNGVEVTNTVLDQQEGTDIGSGEGVNPPNHLWGFEEQVPINQPSVINVHILEADDTLNGDDDVVDIDPNVGSQTLTLTVDPITGHYTADNPHDSWPAFHADGTEHNTDTGTGHISFSLHTDFLDPGQDTDGDGLPNLWEVNGVQLNGHLYNLPGADPLHKDLYVEVDAMAGRGPSLLPPITVVSNTTPIVITSNNNGLTTGTQIKISGVQGNTGANGTFTVTRLTENTFILNGSHSTGAYTGGGGWSLTSIGESGTIPALSLSLNPGQDPNLNSSYTIVVTSPHHGLVNNETVQISNLTGSTPGQNGSYQYAVDGTYYIKRLDDDHFSLDRLIINGLGVYPASYSGAKNYLGGGTWSIVGPDAPTHTTLDLVTDAFKRAPVQNPDGTTGINLHIQKDELNLPLASWLADFNGNGVTPVGGDSAEWSGAAQYTAFRNQNFGTPAERADPGALEAKKLAYRYAVFADQVAAPVDSNDLTKGMVVGSSGVAYGYYGFAVTLGGFPSLVSADGLGGQADEQAAVFMHELGHTLGLGEGGNAVSDGAAVRDDIDYKPNYFSVMNDLWQIPANGLHNESAWALDYSRFALPDIDEAHVNESAGLGGDPTAQIAVGPTAPGKIPRKVSAGGPVDLNGDGKLDTSLSLDLNRIVSDLPSSPGQILKGRDDWNHLIYALGVSGLGNGTNFDQPIDPENNLGDLLTLEGVDPSKLSVSDATVTEGNSGTQTITFKVTLDKASHQYVSTAWQVAFGGMATAADLTGPINGSLTFSPGEVEKTITLQVVGNTTMQMNRTFIVNLLNPIHAVLYDNFGLGTILDDDLQAVYPPPYTAPFSNGSEADPTFGGLGGNGGFVFTQPPVVTPGGSGENNPGAILTDSNGRVIIVTNSLAVSSAEAAIKVIRYNPNGQLDTTFDSDGFAALAPAGMILNGVTGAVYQSGPNKDKILVFGFWSNYPSSQLIAMRFNVDGSIDRTFGGDAGFITFPFSVAGDKQVIPKSVTIYESGPNVGKAVFVATGSPNGSPPDFMIAQLNGDGSVDKTFGDSDGLGGKTGARELLLSYTDSSQATRPYDITVPNRVLIDSTGRILIGGYAGLPNSTPAGSFNSRAISGALIRLNTDGSFDSSFHDGYNMPGVVFAPYDSSATRPDLIQAMSLQSDGKILISGTIDSSHLPKGYLARLNPNGTPDISFATTGFEKFDTQIWSNVSAGPDGKIYVTNSTLDSMRFNADGSPDLTFDDVAFNENHDGLISLNLSPPLALASHTTVAQAIGPDGGFFISGDLTQSGAYALLLAKFTTQRDDLAVTLQGNNSGVLTNHTLTYTITVQNNGDDASFASIRDFLPAGTTFVSAQVPTGWTYDGTGAAFIASNRNLKRSDGIQTITLTVNVAGVNQQLLSNSVNVASLTDDFNFHNNTAQTDLSLYPDLALQARSNHVGSSQTGDQVSFLYTIKNNGTVTDPFTLTVPIPLGASFVSAGQGGSFDGTKITWNGAPLAPGAETTVMLTLQATTAGHLSATGTVTSTVPDVTPLDNTATSITDFNANPTGLISFWGAEGNANDLQGVHNGTLGNGVAFAPGQFGQAFSFDGVNDYVDLGTWFNLQSYSISFWVNPGSTQQQYADIIDNNHGSTNWTVEQVGSNTNQYVWGSGEGAAQYFSLNANQWQMVTLTRDGATRSDNLYINGQLYSSVIGSGDITYNPPPSFRLGGFSQGGRNFNGLMDEVGAFSRALTTEDVKALFANSILKTANTAPTISRTQSSVTFSITTGASNTGTFHDPDGDDNSVFLSASLGTVTADPLHPGQWSWSILPTATVTSDQTVVITVNDGYGGITTTSFLLKYVNVAPVLHTAGSPKLSDIAEDTFTSSGTSIKDLIASTSPLDYITDANANAAEGIALYSAPSSGGNWQYTLNNGGTWNPVTGISPTNALLLTADAAGNTRLRFVPLANFNGTRQAYFRAWDQTTGTNGGFANISTNGAATAFSSQADSATITVTPVNDAPLLFNFYNPVIPKVNKSATNNPGFKVSAMIASTNPPPPNDYITDVDGGVEGIAIYQVQDIGGHWEYFISSDPLAHWTPIGPVGISSALLLKSDATTYLRFVPNGIATGDRKIFFHAWDQSNGAAGTKFDASVLGTTSPFSVGADSATLTVNTVNDAPVLNAAGSPTLPTISKTNSNPAGISILNLIASGGANYITDLESTDPQGIAIYAAPNSGGTWEYSLDSGAHWTGVGTVDQSHSLLLKAVASTLIRFRPLSTFTGTRSISFSAWDQSTGVEGTKVDTNYDGATVFNRGGTTPFSIARDTASITVN